MSKFVLFLLGTIFGIILGGALIFYFFGGVPRAANAPGNPIKPPDAAIPAGTATVTLNQDFFNAVLGTIFRDMNAPAFPLNLTGGNSAQSGNGCDGNIVLLPEGSGTKTALNFENNQITLPLAFRGSAVVFGNCVQFTGWAQANLELRFDEQQQTVFGQINVQTVNLDGVSPIISGFVTPIVQTTLNNRVNPITILRGEQIALKIPVAATNSTLQANVKDVRAEVKNNALNLYVTYDFKGIKQ